MGVSVAYAFFYEVFVSLSWLGRLNLLRVVFFSTRCCILQGTQKLIKIKAGLGTATRVLQIPSLTPAKCTFISLFLSNQKFLNTIYSVYPLVFGYLIFLSFSELFFCFCIIYLV